VKRSGNFSFILRDDVNRLSHCVSLVGETNTNKGEGYDDKYNSQEILTEKSIESKLRELTGAKNP
jgi:hypothetical protein